jgi:hypothetical protein
MKPEKVVIAINLGGTKLALGKVIGYSLKSHQLFQSSCPERF